MVDRLRFSRVLKGARGEAPVDLDAIVATLLRVSQIACDHPRICEIDINPLIVHSTGAVAVDARMRVD